MEKTYTSQTPVTFGEVTLLNRQWITGVLSLGIELSSFTELTMDVDGARLQITCKSREELLRLLYEAGLANILQFALGKGESNSTLS